MHPLRFDVVLCPPHATTPRRGAGGRWLPPLLALLLLVLNGCATVPPELSAGRELAAQGRLEEAVQVLQAGSARAPQERELRVEWVRQRDLWLSSLLAQAEAALQARDVEAARNAYDKVLQHERSHPRALAGLAGIDTTRRLDQRVSQADKLLAAGDALAAEGMLRDVLSQQPGHSAARRALAKLREGQQAATLQPPTLKGALTKTISLELRDTPLRNAFDVISRAAPLNFVFDRDVKGDARVSIAVRGSPVDDVIRLLLATQALDSKVLNDNSLLIYPDTPAKQREYRELTTRLFYLSNADAKQVQALLKNVGKIKEVHVDERLNLVVVRDSAEAVRLAEKLIAGVDLAEPEVMLEVEVLEITRSRLRDLGVNFPTEVKLESRLPLNSTVAGGRIALNGLTASALNATILNPALRLGLQSTDTDVNLLANPRIRAKNHEKARILIGEKLPVFTSTAVQNAGVSSSVSYLDVGLKLEVEPTVFLDDDVAIKVQLEVTSNLERVTNTDGSAAFRLGTRTAQTSLRLRDGETQVLAGLINDSDRQTLSKLPGIGDLPGIGRAFGNTNRTHDKTEIVLLITPRVLRNLTPPDVDGTILSAGTEAASGARPLSIAATAARGLSIPLSGGAGGPAAARNLPGVRAAAAGTGDSAAQITPVGEAPAAEASTASAAIRPSSALRVPDEVSIGREFTVQVVVTGTGDATSGEAVLQFDATVLQGSGASGGRLVVPLTAAGEGQLGASVTLRAAVAGTGATVLGLNGGTVRLRDGTQAALPGTAATVRIGL